MGILSFGAQRQSLLETEHKRLGAIERINSRPDNDFSFEGSYMRGKARITARAAPSMAMMTGVCGRVRKERGGKDDRKRASWRIVPRNPPASGLMR